MCVVQINISNNSSKNRAHGLTKILNIGADVEDGAIKNLGSGGREEGGGGGKDQERKEEKWELTSTHHSVYSSNICWWYDCEG